MKPAYCLHGKCRGSAYRSSALKAFCVTLHFPRSYWSLFLIFIQSLSWSVAEVSDSKNGKITSTKEIRPPRLLSVPRTIWRILFIAVRSTVPLIIYSLLVPPTSSLSLASRFPWAAPSSPIPVGTTSIPFVPEMLLASMKQHLNLDPYPALVFLGALLPSFSFAAYNALWRREKFPLTGQGGSLQVTTKVNMIDVIHGLLFAYTASRNPTWSPLIMDYCPAIFLLGFALHVTADHTKYLFRKDPRNKGKVYTGSVWGIVRHPNFLGFTVWRTAFAVMAGGWAFGGLLFLQFMYLFGHTSMPVLEGYMAKSYGRQWELATEKVRWKLIPWIW